jgi:peptide/nickel transport system permease protein
MAPGFGVDERALDPRLSRQSLNALVREHDAERNPLTFYVHYLAGLVHGDAGRSTVFGQPVAALIGERAPVTARTVMAGLTLGWGAALLFAVAGAASRKAAAGWPSAESC